MMEIDFSRHPILVVDDEQDNLDAFRFVFRKSFALHYAEGGAEALALLSQLDPAVIVSDQRMPGMSGIELLRRAMQLRRDTVGVLLTAYTDLPVLLEAINSGAVYRYVQKPWDSKELTVILRQAIERSCTLRENARLREQLAHYAGYLEAEQQDPLDFADLSTQSPSMRTAVARLEQLAASTKPVLVAGEPGTEKDLFARALHVGSAREGRPYVHVSCAGLSADALARELFGWQKGAFDGAITDRPGRIELSEGGTLVLADLGDLSPGLADDLEGLLSKRQVRRLGQSAPIEVDVRIVATTARSPEAIAARSRFGRALAESALVVPPLRERVDDLPHICQQLLAKLTRRHGGPARRVGAEALAVLGSYLWPGNLREVETVIERAVLICEGATIRPEHVAILGAPVARPAPAEPPDGAAPRDLPTELDDIERRELCAALERCGGNKAEVARMLGIQRTTLYYRLRRLGLDV
jgi:two-component system, NtrC family, response regulator AtoC